MTDESLRARRLLVTLAWLVPLVALAVFLFMNFAPLADAAGGCGGG